MFKPANARQGKIKTNSRRPRVERVAMAKSARLNLDGADMNVPCTVRDMSSRGARISVANAAGIPDEFLLIIRSENLVARAKIEWRNQVELGMLFLRRGELFEEKKYLQMQAVTYKKERDRIAEAARQEKRIEDEKRAIAEQQNQVVVEERIRTIKILGLDHTRRFSEADLKRAYRHEAMKKHPDHGGTMDEFMELNTAYRTLISSLREQQNSPKIISL